MSEGTFYGDSKKLAMADGNVVTQERLSLILRGYDSLVETPLKGIEAVVEQLASAHRVEPVHIEPAIVSSHFDILDRAT